MLPFAIEVYTAQEKECDMILSEICRRIHGLHISVAEDVWPDGAILICVICGKEKKIDIDECAHYLALGWPKCCSRTMIAKQGST